VNEIHMSLRGISGALGGYAYRYSTEAQLHDRFAEVLERAGLAFERERTLDDKNRADFWIDGIVVEVKVDGTLTDALRQVARYIELPQVTGVLLASTKSWAAAPLRERPKWAGKPFGMMQIRRQAL
jgi:hypothetical protein